MRPIKFRAYLKESKITKPVEAIYFPLGSNSGKDLIIMDCWFSFDEIELMQYTGLKDKNEKELYFDYYVHVYFGGKYHKTAPITDIHDLSGLIQLINEHGASFKIYGNKYENPELIKGDST